ncbi:spore coat U domain-containing protein [Acinetobacter calcoaceticus]|uniref:Csu type fimbrial protein n=1 Tax=Acinetobacter calcoaceticus TaxID=471 RepID=UPI0019018D35|nr:spore coat U domain-containing protein [Acinetobacter calcoaceticus]MBJ9721127.1 spore coat U domain-containing protein [Acinetobacter calcoaceticus]
MKVLKYTLFSLMGMLIINSADAGNTSTSLKVSLTIIETCEVSTQGNLDFGSVVRSQPVADAITNISVQCSKNTPYQLAVTSDNNFELKSAASTASVAYVLYQDAGHTQIWAGSGGKIRSGVATGMKENIPIHGAITSSTNVQATKYEDWVRVNVIY